MSVYREFARVYARGPFAAFSEQVLARLPDVLARYDLRPRTALDVACGAGGFAIGLARLGIAATGVDLSPEMLAVARADAREAGVEVRFVEQDVRRLDLPDRFDLVTCLFDSLNYLLDEADLAEALRRMRRTVAPGGLLLFDMNTIRGLATRWNTHVSIEQDADDAFVVVAGRYDHDTAIAEATITAFVRDEGDGPPGGGRPRADRAVETPPAAFFRGGWRQVREVHRERGYPVETITRLLHDAGFGAVEAFGSLQFAPVRRDTGRVWITARP